MFSKEVNLFESRVYIRRVVFDVQKESNLAEIWEYYLLEHEARWANETDVVRAIYDCGVALLESNITFTVVQEEDSQAFYLTIWCSKQLDGEKLKNILFREYKSAIYMMEEGKLSFKLSKSGIVHDVKQPLKTPIIEIQPTFHENITIDDYEKAVLKAGYKVKISAADFVESLPDGFDDKVEKLKISEDLMDDYIYKLEGDFDPNLISVISAELKEYGGVIEELYEFKNLAYSIGELADFIKNMKTDLNPKDARKFIALIKATHSDLREWSSSIFDKRQAVDIHYLDSSLMSSCIQVKAMFEDKNISDEEELELF